MSSAVLCHSPSGLLTWVLYHIISDPGPRIDQCPRVNLRAYSTTLWAFAIQFYLFPRFPQSMSLYIDMKMILPLHGFGSHFDSAIIFWISSRIPNVVNPGKMSTRIPFVPRRSDPDLWENVFPKTIYSSFPRLWPVQYWYLLDSALIHKRRKSWQLQTEQLCQ